MPCLVWVKKNFLNNWRQLFPIFLHSFLFPFLFYLCHFCHLFTYIYSFNNSPLALHFHFIYTVVALLHENSKMEVNFHPENFCAAVARCYEKERKDVRRKTSLFPFYSRFVIGTRTFRVSLIRVCLCICCFCFCYLKICVLNIIRNKDTISHETVPGMKVCLCRMQCAMQKSVLHVRNDHHLNAWKWFVCFCRFSLFSRHSIPLCDGVSWANVSLFICRVRYNFLFVFFFFVSCATNPCIAHILYSSLWRVDFRHFFPRQFVGAHKHS